MPGLDSIVMNLTGSGVQIMPSHPSTSASEEKVSQEPSARFILGHPATWHQRWIKIMNMFPPSLSQFWDLFFFRYGATAIQWHLYVFLPSYELHKVMRITGNLGVYLRTVRHWARVSTCPSQLWGKKTYCIFAS